MSIQATVQYSSVNQKLPMLDSTTMLKPSLLINLFTKDGAIFSSLKAMRVSCCMDK